MCGRFGNSLPLHELGASLEEELTLSLDYAPGLEEHYRPSFHIAPSQRSLVCLEERGQARLFLSRWGLLPPWQKRPDTGFINARIESAAEKPSFRDAYRQGRILIPATGWFEWEKVGKDKIPSWFYPEKGPMFYFAGLLQKSPPSFPFQTSFSILTCDAREDLAFAHHRMPLLIENPGDWLSKPPELPEIMAKMRDIGVRHHRVSKRVNQVQNDSPELIEEAIYPSPKAEPQQGQLF